MTILTQEAYELAVKNKIKGAENSDVTCGFYQDTDLLNDTSLVIGYGYDLRKHTLSAIMTAFTAAGIFISEDIDRNSFEALIRNFKTSSIPDIATHTKIDLNNLFLTSGFTFSETNANLLLDHVFQIYETRLINHLNSNLNDSFLSQLVKHPSTERVVLLDMLYNGGEGLIGGGLCGALNADNRANAWYEIRYNSNSGSSRDTMAKGIANRRIAQSDSFQLLSNNTDKECRDTYIMYWQNKSNIDAYEDASDLDGIFNSTNNIQSQLSPASQYFNNTYASQHGRIYDWDQIVVAVDGTCPTLPDSITNKGVLVIGSQEQDNSLYGTEHNDILQGGNTVDYLVGGLGEDILVGNDGNDVLEKIAA